MSAEIFDYSCLEVSDDFVSRVKEVQDRLLAEIEVGDSDSALNARSDSHYARWTAFKALVKYVVSLVVGDQITDDENISKYLSENEFGAFLEIGASDFIFIFQKVNGAYEFRDIIDKPLFRLRPE